MDWDTIKELLTTLALITATLEIPYKAYQAAHWVLKTFFKHGRHEKR